MARYTIKGVEYPSVTQIIDMLDKSNALIPWAVNSMGIYILQYYDPKEDINDLVNKAKYNYREISQEAKDIGTEVHDLIEIYIKHKIDPTKDKDLNESVTNALIAFLEWEKENIIEWLHSERRVHCESIGYAGKLDAIAKMKDGRTLVLDFKSSKGFYDGYDLQISGYKYAAEELDNIKYDGMGIVRLDKLTGLPEFKDYSKVYEQKIKAFHSLVEFYYFYKKRRLKNNPRVQI